MKSKGGRPPHKRDEAIARQVEAMVGYGVPLKDICAVVGIGSENTLKKHYGDEIGRGAARANARVAESLFKKATGEGPASVTAAIFWLKARAGWVETDRHEVSGPEGGPVQTETVSRDADEFAGRVIRLAAARGEGGGASEA